MESTTWLEVDRVYHPDGERLSLPPGWRKVHPGFLSVEAPTLAAASGLIVCPWTWTAAVMDKSRKYSNTDSSTTTVTATQHK